jgi:hypothetical protein
VAYRRENRDYILQPDLGRNVLSVFRSAMISSGTRHQGTTHSPFYYYCR